MAFHRFGTCLRTSDPLSACVCCVCVRNASVCGQRIRIVLDAYALARDLHYTDSAFIEYLDDFGGGK